MDNIASWATTTLKHHTCNYPSIHLQAKYPFVVIRIKHEMKGKGQIHVGRPIEWLGHGLLFQLREYNYWSQSDRIFPKQHLKGSIIIQKGDKKKNVSESITLKKFLPQKLCVDSNILPGRWEYDVNYIVSDENKWGSCSIHPEYKHRACSPYYASQPSDSH
eukprot:gene8373-9059_t